MTNPAFLIDGRMEQEFFRHICPNKPVQYINCNGKNVNLKAMAKKITTLIRVLGGKHFPIIIIIDRENREETPSEIIAELSKLIKANGISDMIIIGVADRETENWILADCDLFKEYPDYQRFCAAGIEGTYGKTIIEKIIPEYHETTIGVELLKRSNPKQLCNSPSFKILFDQISMIDSWWIKKGI